MDSATAAPPPAIICSVLGESRGRSVKIHGQILSRELTKGSYRLLVDKAGPNGQSSVAQGGTFMASAGEPVIVGIMTLNLEPGASMEARLQVMVGASDVTCHSYLGDHL